VSLLNLECACEPQLTTAYRRCNTLSSQDVADGKAHVECRRDVELQARTYPPDWKREAANYLADKANPIEGGRSSEASTSEVKRDAKPYGCPPKYARRSLCQPGTGRLWSVLEMGQSIVSRVFRELVVYVSTLGSSTNSSLGRFMHRRSIRRETTTCDTSRSPTR
jgi:hypothetical protein